MTEFGHFVGVLREFGSQERLLQADLQRRAGLSQGQAYRVFHDAKLLGLLTNGDGLSITPLGRQWVREADEKGLPSPSTLRQAALNVPLFAQTMRDLPDVRNPDQIYAYFCARIDPTTRPKDISCSRRRYLEAVCQRQLPRAISNGAVTPRSPLPTPARERRLQLATAYSNLIQTYGEDSVSDCHAFFFGEEKR